MLGSCLANEIQLKTIGLSVPLPVPLGDVLSVGQHLKIVLGVAAEHTDAVNVMLSGVVAGALNKLREPRQVQIEGETLLGGPAADDG